MQPELTLIAARVVVGVNAFQVELPCFGGAIESVFQGDAVANLPAKAFREPSANNCALTIIYEVLPLVVGNLHLRHDLALIFGVDHKLGEEVLLILIDAAEPIVVRKRLDALDGQNLVPIRERNGLNEPRPVDNH